MTPSDLIKTEEGFARKPLEGRMNYFSDSGLDCRCDMTTTKKLLDNIRRGGTDFAILLMC